MVQVAVAIIENSGKLLIAKREKNDPLKGRWEFPGGKIEGTETAEECIQREVFEELGVKVSVHELICSSKHRYEHVSVELLAYRAIIISGEISSQEYKEIQWVSLSDLHSYSFPAANRVIIDKLMNEL